MGEDQAFIYFNDGIHEKIDETPEQLARIRLSYKNPRPNGLPGNSEFDTVSELEEEMETFSKKNGDFYVGRVTVAGYRYFYVYTQTSNKQWEAFIADLSTRLDYELAISFRNDPEHADYWNELYPGDDDWQVIKDMDVLENLQENGDIAGRKRQVRHWAYFETKSNADSFADWIAEKDYQLLSNGQDNESGEHLVLFMHVGTMELGDITRHTIASSRKARELSGRYDGWETRVAQE